MNNKLCFGCSCGYRSLLGLTSLLNYILILTYRLFTLKDLQIYSEIKNFAFRSSKQELF